MLIKKIIEEVKNECSRKEDFLTPKQEEILKYYMEFYLKDLF